jgi:NMD protein affecting ribosome stability and mRNA decay
MKLINCKNCGKLTIERFEGFCPECNAERDRVMSLIKDFILLNKRVGINELTDETELSAKLVLEFIQEGRLGVSRVS